MIIKFLAFYLHSINQHNLLKRLHIELRSLAFVRACDSFFLRSLIVYDLPVQKERNYFDFMCCSSGIGIT